MTELEQPHGYLAAEELLSNLQAVPELSLYLMPELWAKQGQHSTIQALAFGQGVAVAVGLAEPSLPAAGSRKQGGLVRIGLAVYIFQPAEGTRLKGEEGRLQHRIWLTLVKYLNQYHYTRPNGHSSKAVLTSVAEIDLSGVNPSFAKAVTASAIQMDIPLQLLPNH